MIGYRKHQHYVVWATHPAEPNYGPQARARKLHLAIDNAKRTKTLCNMMVVKGVPFDGPEKHRPICLTCTAKAQEISDKQREGVTYRFTINTDASLYRDRTGVNPSIGAWACWIKSKHYHIKDAGLLPDGLPNSSVAELLAVEQALLLLDKLISTEKFLQHQLEHGKIYIVFNTDSLFAIRALQGTIKRKTYRPIVQRVRALAARYEISPRHVKGHTDGDTAREWVNNWCDQQARGLAHARLREVNASKSAKKV